MPRPPARNRRKSATRREFIQAVGAAAVTVPVLPLILHAQDKSGSKAAVVGEGAHGYDGQH